MKQHWLARNETEKLVVIFGGWALGKAPFQGMRHTDDALLIEDFTEIDHALPELDTYARVDMLCFSFGVATAAHWLAQTGYKPHSLTAINGTLTPSHETLGIPPKIARGTAEKLSGIGFRKFCKRAGLATQAIPTVDITTAQRELIAILDRGPAPAPPFDRIWISENDRILPPEAQMRAWAPQHHSVRRVAAAHIPFQNGQDLRKWLP